MWTENKMAQFVCAVFATIFAVANIVWMCFIDSNRPSPFVWPMLTSMFIGHSVRFFTLERAEKMKKYFTKQNAVTVLFFLAMPFVVFSVLDFANAHAFDYPGPQPTIPAGASTSQKEQIKKLTFIIYGDVSKQAYWLNAHDVNMSQAAVDQDGGIDPLYGKTVIDGETQPDAYWSRIADAGACLTNAAKARDKEKFDRALLAKLLTKIAKRKALVL